MSADDLSASFELIAAILTLCHQNPNLCAFAQTRLEAIVSLFQVPAVSAPPSGAKHHIKQEIEGHIARLSLQQRQLRPTSVTYRRIAEALAKHHNIPFDPKRTKKKEDVLQWLETHWPKVRTDFFVLLETKELM